jgi:hypothetical protein
MKSNQNQKLANSAASMKRSIKRTGLHGSFLAAVLMIFLVPIDVMASRERFVLDFADSQIRGNRGEAATIFLRRSLRNQYPWADLSTMDLRRVVLVAKSRRGRGGASLRVGNNATGLYQVAGAPRDFSDDHRYTFDRVRFRNPSTDSRGPWQIDLRGNFIVRKVVLELEDHTWNRHNKRWRDNGR